jgi:hypothetical protein
MTDARPTITAEVLEWIVSTGPGVLTIGGVCADLPHLTRRQVTSALHGLAEHGLEHQLHNVGKGLWRYSLGDAVDAFPDSRKYQYHWPSSRPRELTLGEVLPEMRVIAIRRSSHGLTYMSRDDDGAMYLIEPIFEVESFYYIPDPDESD